jgi:predicted nucleic acid-binding protein
VNTIVPDVSVAAKWVLPPNDEDFHDEAFELLRRHRDGEIRLVVPDIFWAELGNVLWKAVRFKRLSHGHALAGIELVLAEQLPSVPSAHLLTHAFNIASVYGRAVYDSLYVALAVTAKAEMVTADERLANAVAAHLPVKWIGAIS